MPLTLRDLVARGTPLEWFESVAIVQELAAAVAKDAGSKGPRVPDLPGAELLPDGTVRILDAGGADQAPVFRLAHVLNALLSGGTPPVQLRLLVLTALAPEPTYKTVLEFTQALEYFERPDRRLVNRAVYERAIQLPAVESEVAPLPDKPEAAKPAPKEKKERVPWRRGQVLLAACMPVVIGIAIGGWWATTRPAGKRVLTETKELVSKAVAATVDTVRSGLGGRTGAQVNAEAAPVAASPAVAVKHAAAAAPRPIRPDRSLARNGLAPLAGDAPFAAPEASPSQQVDEVIWLDPPPADGTAGAVARAYSPLDVDVRPPVAVRPKLPSEPPPGVPLEALTRLEVLVSASGEVEAIKILAGPRNALDGMMLSAVKAWQFQPATKDGRPVPYRHVVWLTNR